MRLVSQCALATRCERNGDARFSGFDFDYGGMAGAFSSHPPPFDSPPLAQTHEDEGEEEEEEEEEEDEDE
jgi:hypothetical protein